MQNARHARPQGGKAFLNRLNELSAYPALLGFGGSMRAIPVHIIAGRLTLERLWSVRSSAFMVPFETDTEAHP